MNGRFFLDTNVFVYSFDQSAPAKARKAAELIRRAVASGKGIVSYQVAQEFFNAALRRFARPTSSRATFKSEMRVNCPMIFRTA